MRKETQKIKIGAAASGVTMLWRLGQALSTVGVGITTAIFAKAVDFFDRWEPLSYWLAFLFGVAFALFSWWLYAKARITLRRYNMFATMEIEPRGVDPLSPSFSRKRIILRELAPPEGLPIVNRQFHSCEIIGPAVIAMGNTHLHSAHLHNCETVFSSEKNLKAIPNKILVQRCSFHDCKFFNIFFLVNESERKVMPKETFGWLN